MIRDAYCDECGDTTPCVTVYEHFDFDEYHSLYDPPDPDDLVCLLCHTITPKG